MKTNVVIDRKYFKSDCINNGRIIGDFFCRLSKNVICQSLRYYNEHKYLTKTGEIPVLQGERNIYSTFAAAIDKITPVHLSEYAFNKSDYKVINNRRVDFWCLNRNKESGRPINYYIELKKGFYCLNENTDVELTSTVVKDVKSLVKQATTIKKISPNFADHDDVFLGVMVVHGYYNKDKAHYNEKHVRDEIYKAIDKRTNAQMMFVTWLLPNSTDVQWDKDKCRFVSMAGIAISKKK